jgi:hypothetical protein
MAMSSDLRFEWMAYPADVGLAAALGPRVCPHLSRCKD